MKSNDVRRSLLALSLVAVIAGCSKEPAAPATDTAATPVAQSAEALPEGWQRVVGVDVPDIEGATQQLPAQVTSDDGVATTVTDTSKIIAGGDDIIAVLEALGLDDQVYAAPLRSATESGRKAPKQFLFNRTTGVEGVLSLQGSLFLGNSLRRHSDLAAKLRGAGEAAVIVDDLQPAADKVRKVAAAVGMAEQGEALASKVQSQLDAAKASGAALAWHPRVIHVSATGAGGAPTVAGSDSASGKLITLAGGINIGDEAGVANYSALSNEGVVAAAPDVILVTENDLALFGGQAGLWRAYPTLRQTPAGAANRVWVMPDVELKSASVASGSGAVALAAAFATVPRP